MDVDTVIGSSWENLFPSCNELPIVIDRPPPELDPVETFLPEHAILIFGRCPESDPFFTIACDFCNKLLMPAAMPKHLLRHGDGLAVLKEKAAQLRPIILKKQPKAITPPPPEICVEEPRIETSNVICSACSISIPCTAFRRHVLKLHSDDPTAKPLPLKVKTAKKSSPSKKCKSASVSPPDLTDEVAKDVRKTTKYKKCKSPIPPELEPIMPAAKRIIVPNGPPELSPIDLPKKSSKKKIDRKADRIYDPNKNCGVVNDAGKPCLRSILCKAHLVAQKRAVLNRGMSYDALTKLYKSQGEEGGKPKIEAQIPMEPPPVALLTVNLQTTDVWPEPLFVEPLEPLVKRCKTVDVEDDHYGDLPSDDEALIEATLKDLEEREPILRWSYEAPVCAPSNPPPMYFLPDVSWHTSHPKPLATNTFGCRLVGGLMTKCKKLDAFRKHVQSVWGGGQSPGDATSKFVGFATKGGATMKKVDLNQKRKRKSSGSEIMAELLQRAAAAAPPNGVNGVNRGLFQTNVSANPASFIQLNLCSSK